MVKLRDKKRMDRPPPKYKPLGAWITLVVHHGGKFVTSPVVKYVGGDVIKLDWVVTKQLNLETFRNSVMEWLLIGEVFRIYVVENGYFKLVKFEDQFTEYCNGCLESREVVFYIDEEHMGMWTDVEGNTSRAVEDDGNVQLEEVACKRKGKARGPVEGSTSGDVEGLIDTELGSVYVLLEEVEGERKGRARGPVEGSTSGDVEGLIDTDLGSVYVSLEEVEGERKDRADPAIEEDDSDDLEDSDYDMIEESEDGDDDILYDANVNDNVADSSEDSEGEPDVVNVEGHCFDEIKDSDDEAVEPQNPIFNPEVIFEPEFELGLLFGSRDEFKMAVQSHAIRSKRSLKFSKTAPTRVYVKCGDNKCGWKIHLNKMKNEDTWQIRQYVDSHTCDPSFHVKNVKAKWLSEKFLRKFVTDRKRKVSVFRQDVIDELGCEVSKDQAARAKRLALRKLEGDPDMQYAKLWDYAEELRRSNPGSTVLVGTEDSENGGQRFKSFYVCLDAVKKGFQSGCRPIIGVDGCHLKGPHKGILLTAVGVDANNNIFPISWAVVDREARETWEWFLIVLRQDLNLGVDSNITFMSDKQKGLIQAMSEVFPYVDHRFCVRHLHGNFKLAGFRGLTFKTYLWNAAQASTVREWKRRMDELKNFNETAWSWLVEKPAEQWSKSHFREDPKCEMLLNNVSESFNSTILEAREMPILTMLEWIREWMMVRFQKQRDLANLKWKGRICPKIKKVLEKHAQKVADCIPIKGDKSHYQIKCSDGGQYVVDLDLQSCSCRLWGLSGIPCKHAICAINHDKGNRVDYVDDCYTLERQRQIYAATVKGINGQQLWGESMFIPPLPPSLIKGRGRPVKQRRKEPDEACKKDKKKTKLKRRQSTTVKCRKCGMEGHNALTCGRYDQPEEDNIEIQEVESSSQPRDESTSMLPPQDSEVYIDEELSDAIPTQTSQIQGQKELQRGPSMHNQLQQGKAQTQGAKILESEKKFVSLASLQQQSRKK